MMKTRYKYEVAFKERAVRLSKERKNLSEPARELNMYPAQLYKWCKAEKEFGTGSFPGNGNLKQTPEQERKSILEMKLKDAELERNILKKAIGIFSRSDR